MRRTRLSRKQLRYLEERGLIGAVIRSDDRRIFSERQVTMLEVLSRLRDLGLALDEASVLAAECVGGEAVVADDRLDHLVTQILAENEQRARLARELDELKRRRRAPADRRLACASELPEATFRRR